jgi:flavin reductase (DIM6/NTAB) family NADH-FMN oxidoreductase RutF
MKKFIKLDPKTVDMNPFSTLDDNWMLITARSGEKVNTMTASWGGLGVLWNKNVAYVFVRPQRYTRELIDESDHFSLNILDHETYRKELEYLGKASGRDEDKIAKSKLTLAYSNEVPYFQEADQVLICRKLSRQQITKDSFIEAGLAAKNYPTDDFHYVYVGEIEDFLVKEEI